RGGAVGDPPRRPHLAHRQPRLLLAAPPHPRRAGGLGVSGTSGTGGTGAPLVAAHGVTVRLGATTVLREVSAHVAAGEVVAFVGPNGAGKSTLLGAMAGDLPLAAGRVEVEGRALGDWDALDLARTRAVMPQRTAVAFPFLVSEVVRMGRAPWLGTPQEADDDD